MTGSIDSALAWGDIFHVKYKHIPSLIHNFTDSYMSLVNHCAEGYCVDLLKSFLEKTPGTSAMVGWHPALTHGENVPVRLRENFSDYARWFPRLARSMGVDPNRILSVSTSFRLESGVVVASIKCEDDRGKIFSGRPKFCWWQEEHLAAN